MPSARLAANPSGLTSTSFAVKSVSGADDSTHSSTRTGPATATGASSTGELKQSTSSRRSTSDWSSIPAPMIVGISVFPPTVGTGSRGS